MTVTLRRAAPDDVDFLVDLIADEETRRFLGSGAADTREQALADVARSQREPQAYGWFVIEADGERAGCVNFERTSERHRIAHAGRFAIHPRFRGRRIGIDAAHAFQRHLIRDLGFHRIELRVYGFNERAIAHAERSGYRREGVHRLAYWRDGRWEDAVLFALVEEDLD
ncbi:MAG: GNAT family N-acetyltransferase [Actinomycetota bacterium]